MTAAVAAVTAVAAVGMQAWRLHLVDTTTERLGVAGKQPAGCTGLQCVQKDTDCKGD